jgi:hypothetical protein
VPLANFKEKVPIISKKYGVFASQFAAFIRLWIMKMTLLDEDEKEPEVGFISGRKCLLLQMAKE